MSLTIQNIESELSYAYLHAVASRAGINCQFLNRHSDNSGVDAQLTYQNDPSPTSTYIEEAIIQIQLKATQKTPYETSTHFSYSFHGITQYNDLRKPRGSGSIKILVVMFLENDPKEWLNCTQNELLLKKASYWVSLVGAPATKNGSATTIYVPKNQLLTPDSLLQISQDTINKVPLIYQNPKP